MNVDLYAVSTKKSYKQAHLHVQEPTYFFFFFGGGGGGGGSEVL